jgi:arsenate reductase-like glutaredoxin family protein
MKFKNFNDYLKTGVCPKKIKEIEVQVELEFKAFKSFQNGMAQALNAYMKQQKLGFDELVRILEINPEKLSSDGLLPVTRSGETIWLAPGQGIRVQDWR